MITMPLSLRQAARRHVEAARQWAGKLILLRRAEIFTFVEPSHIDDVAIAAGAEADARRAISPRARARLELEGRFPQHDDFSIRR